MNFWPFAKGKKRSARVLVAEDEPETAILITQFLKARGINVDYAKDGLEALSLAQTAEPDVILMDISLPRLNGLDALAQMKANPKTRAIPVVMCTATRRVNEVAEASQKGATAYVTKPLDFDFLWDKIQPHLPLN